MSSNHAGYKTILSAFIDCERFSKAHCFYLPVQHWEKHSELLAEEKYDSSASQCFRITASNCSDDAKKDVERCRPNHSTLGGCLGWDQFVASSIDNEMAMSGNGPSAMKCIHLWSQNYSYTCVQASHRTDLNMLNLNLDLLLVSISQT